MRKLAILLLLTATAAAQAHPPMRPVATFSIVARDPQTGEMGVAVQSHWFAVGQIVPWAEAGVGAVATQSFVDPSYGKNGLRLMRMGKGYASLNSLLRRDKSCEVRQVAMIDANGNVATFTGSKNILAAGGLAGFALKKGERLVGSAGKENTVPTTCGASGGLLSSGWEFAVQANLMSNEKVWRAMSTAYEQSKGDLAERMLAALDAAQAVGGDIRGRQSAALIVVKAKSSRKPWEDRIFDLRVDDSTEPLKELRRLVTLQRAYNHMNAGDLAVEHKDDEGALREYSTAEKLVDGVPGIEPSRLAEMIYWHAVALVKIGRGEESLPLFRRAFDLHPGWRELTPRLPKSGLLPDDPKLIERITKQ
jgi:uncharacterized Ntn-hydrolase superfamily protein